MAYRYYTRKFLNRRGFHAGAYVLASVDDTSTRPMDKRYEAYADFTIADCGRQISLDFSPRPREIGNSLHKIDLLLDALISFRAALVVEAELAEVRARAETAAKKAKHRSGRATQDGADDPEWCD